MDGTARGGSGGAVKCGDNGRNGGEGGHEASHDFWGRQKLQCARVPISYATPLLVTDLLRGETGVMDFVPMRFGALCGAF